MKDLILALALLCGALPAIAGETGCIYELMGTVEVSAPGGKEWRTAAKGRPVAEGDRIRTSAGSGCEILFKDGTFIKMDENADLSMEGLKASKQARTFSFSFLRGKALWMAAKLRGKVLSKFTVRTPSAVCAVRGTDFSILVSTAAGETSIGLFDGKVAVSGAGTEKELLAGGEASASAGSLTVEGRLSKLMKAEEKRYSRVKGRVEALRKRLKERDAFIDEYIGRQQKKISDYDARREQKLKGRK